MKNYINRFGFEFILGTLLVLMLAAFGLGFEWYVYHTGHLKAHMTFLEWLMIQK